MLEEIVFKIGGEQGQGLDSTADTFATVINRIGYWVYYYKTFQSRIKGGHTDFTIRLGRERVLAAVPRIHVLTAMDQESIDLLSGELVDNGLLLADAHFKPTAPSGVDLIAFDMTAIARELGNPIYRGMISIGASTALLGIPLPGFKDYLAERFGRRGQGIVEANWAALDRGAEEALRLAGSRTFHVAPPIRDGEERILIAGNEAMTLGAFAGGCRAVFAYPITPASEVLETATKVFPKFGGIAVQMEDELSALAACVGAQFAGVRAMTATAGPGISLMQENLGWAGMCEIPVVVIDTQRGGPSTGMPTKQEQSDLFALTMGGHGEAPRIVLTPGTIEQAYTDAALAFNLADNYHCPVLIASDLGLAHWKASVPPFKLGDVSIDRGPLADPEEMAAMGRDAFERYAHTDSGVSPRSFPGQKNGQFLASGAEHGPTGKVTENPANRRYMMDRRLRRQRGTLELNGEPVPGVEYRGDANPEVLLISYGSPIGAVWEGARLLRQEGMRVGVAQVRIIQPLPVSDLQRLIDGAGHTFVVENNALGQFAFLMRGHGVHGRVGSILKYDGTLFLADEVASRTKEILMGEGAVAADD
ncbi:MAG: 2-oxoacid:acceptor oxidoreductase subunit alpha [Dehalococcoidia bacterium]